MPPYVQCYSPLDTKYMLTMVIHDVGLTAELYLPIIAKTVIQIYDLIEYLLIQRHYQVIGGVVGKLRLS